MRVGDARRMHPADGTAHLWPPVRETGTTLLNVIGVVDLLDGSAVHARGGSRADYRPVREVAGTAIPEGDPLAVIREYGALGVREVYVADLDAILQRGHQDELVSALAATDVPLWLDAGVSTAARAQQVRNRGATRVVVGLETLTSFGALAEICESVGSAGSAFSLDLKDGVPLTGSLPADSHGSPEDLAVRAADSGAGAIIVLDLARVGSGAGLDLPLIERIRRRVPGVTLIAGGGVRGMDDLTDLASAGCDGALVGTALLSGRLRIPMPPS